MMVIVVVIVVVVTGRNSGLAYGCHPTQQSITVCC